MMVEGHFNPGLFNPGVEMFTQNLGLKLGVENSRVEMSFNRDDHLKKSCFNVQCTEVPVPYVGCRLGI